MNLILRTLPELLVISRIPSETPNILRTYHIWYLISTLATSSVKCVTLRVREYVDMTETLLWSIINSGTMDIHNDSHILTKDLLSVWTTVSNIPFPLSRDILLARDSIVGITIPSSISFPASTLYSFRNATSFMTNSLVTCLQAILNVLYRVGPEYISPSHGWTNPTLDTCNSTSTFRNTWKTPLWSPCYGVMVDAPKAFFRYPGVALSHGLRIRILNNRKICNMNFVTWSNCFT